MTAPREVKAMLKLAKHIGKTEDDIADLMLSNLWQQFRPYVERQAFARALERLAVSLMTTPPGRSRN